MRPHHHTPTCTLGPRACAAWLVAEAAQLVDRLAHIADYDPTRGAWAGALREEALRREDRRAAKARDLNGVYR